MITKPTCSLDKIAWRALSKLLPPAYEATTRPWLQKHLSSKIEGFGLHLGCGNGTDTFLIASILGEKFSMLGIEEDAVLVEIAKETKSRHQLKHINFIQNSIGIQGCRHQADLIYARLQAACLPELDALLQGIDQNLKPGGKLFIEMMQWTGFKAYPYNHAYSRAIELLSHLENHLPDLTHSYSWLHDIDCSIIYTAFTSPVFIPRHCNQIVSLALEWQRDAILSNHGSSKDEINALLQDLRQFEQQADTLICRPGVRQVFAKKII